MDLVVGLAVALLVAAVGYGVLRRIGGATSALERLALAFPVGIGLWTWGLFLASWAGIPLRLILLMGSLLLLLAISWFPVRHLMGGWEGATGGGSIREEIGRWGWREWFLLALPFVFLLSAAAISVGRAHGTWDTAAGWATKGYGMVAEGSILAGERWGAWGLAYPLNVPLQYGLFQALGAESAPASKLFFPLYLVPILGSMYAFWRRSQVPAAIAGIGVLLLVSNPLIFRHATIGYANLPLAAYLVPGALWAGLAIEGGEVRDFAVSGLLIGLGGWTRPEGLAYFLLMGMAVLGSVLFLQRWGRRWRGLGVWLLAGLVILGPWYIFSWTNVMGSHLGGAMDGALAAWLSGDFRFYELQLIPRLLAKRALIPDRWGFLFPLAAVCAALGVDKVLKARKHARETSLALLTMAAAAVPVGVFYVRAFTRPGQEFVGLLHRSFDRSFLPAAILLFAWAVLMAFSDPEPARPDR